MDMILHEVPNYVCKQDDILIDGVSWQKNIKILPQVLERLHKYNIHLKMAKCEFLKREVVYMGLKIDVEGLHPVDEKVDAVKKNTTPQKCKRIEIFFGHGPMVPPIFTGFSNHTSTIN